MNQISFLQAGSLNRRLSVERRIQNFDALGGIGEGWLPLFDVWAKILPLTSRQQHDGSALVDHTSHNIYLRYRNDIKSGMRFRLLSRIFNIITVRDPDETSRYLHCTVIECA